MFLFGSSFQSSSLSIGMIRMLSSHNLRSLFTKKNGNYLIANNRTFRIASQWLINPNDWSSSNDKASLLLLKREGQRINQFWLNKGVWFSLIILSFELNCSEKFSLVSWSSSNMKIFPTYLWTNSHTHTYTHILT